MVNPVLFFLYFIVILLNILLFYFLRYENRKEDLPGYLIMVVILYGVTLLGLMMLNKVGVNIPFLLQTWPYTYFFYVRQSVIIMLFVNYVVGVVLVYFKLKLSEQSILQIKTVIFAFLMLVYMLFSEGLL